MSYEQYWYQDCYLVQAFRKAEELRGKRIDRTLWLGGAYIYDALLRVSPAFNPLVKKGTKPQPYPEEPYSVTQEKRESEEAKRQQAENERLRAIIFFQNWARATAKRFEEK